MKMKLPKILTQKTFGISNWMLGIGTLGVLYLLTQGFPGMNSSDEFIPLPMKSLIPEGDSKDQTGGGFNPLANKNKEQSAV